MFWFPARAKSDESEEHVGRDHILLEREVNDSVPYGN